MSAGANRCATPRAPREAPRGHPHRAHQPRRARQLRRARRAGRVSPALLVAAALAGALALWAAGRLAEPPPRAPWRGPSRVSQLELLPMGPDDVVFLGASLVEYGEWSELLPDQAPRNRGVAGDTVDDVLARLAPVLSARPRAVFVMVGLNDVFLGRPADAIAARQRELVRRLREGAPDTRVVLMSLLPVRLEGPEGEAANARVAAVNAELERLAGEQGCDWLDLAPAFRDAGGQLRAGFTLDGVHLTGAGYRRWSELLLASGLL